MVRILSKDPDLQMPPPTSGKSLSDSQVETLRGWIQAGAPFQEHWSFMPAVRPALPEGDSSDWVLNPIDRFVLRRLRDSDLEPSPPANRYELVRRVYLDLIGLPPTVAQAEAFVNDPSPTAYEDLVDRLLGSPLYGERWARKWLDLARYADTKGYEKDKPRTMWPYRDWVIEAINDDLPFDQFTIEQIAGDMLPNATVSQRIAAGFHRNTMTNEEGGIDPQEFRFLAVVDRVATTGTTWLGLTLGCAQCHTHKYDPVTHEDYYRFFALLNNANEIEVQVPSNADNEIVVGRRRIEEIYASLAAKLSKQSPRNAAGKSTDPNVGMVHDFEKWLAKERQALVQWDRLHPLEVEDVVPTTTLLSDGSILLSGDATNDDVLTVPYQPIGPITAIRLEAIPHDTLPGGGPGRQTIVDGGETGKGNFFLSEVNLYIQSTSGETLHKKERVAVERAFATFVPPGLSADLAIDNRGDTGWTNAGKAGTRQCLVLVLRQPVNLQPSETLVVELEHEYIYPASLGRFRVSTTASSSLHHATGHTDSVLNALSKAPEELTESDLELLQRRYLEVAPELGDARREIEAIRQSMPAPLTALTFREREIDGRTTHLHHRGEFLSPREVVDPGVPDCLPGLPDGMEANRLSLARWLVSRGNPLTSRVVVNRWWETLFGTGLVKTSADFGIQGEFPSHPELLDWLAVELVDSGWSRKHIHRLIVTSNTYRQSSVFNLSALEKDPENRLLSYAPRRRMDAETVRDTVLHASGLLSPKIGGPSVFPPQPSGITEAAYSPFNWEVSAGEDRYRRGLYTFMKRTAPYAAFSLFDCPSGEFCIAQRDRSNTPLQSLALLNDQVMVEAARNLAMEEFVPDKGPREVARSIFQRCVTRPPTDAELQSILRYHASQLERFAKGELSATQVLNSGPSTKLHLNPNGFAKPNSNDVELDQLDAALQVQSTGVDPYIRHKIDLPAGYYSLEVSACFHTDGPGEVFWTTTNRQQESPSSSVMFKTRPAEWTTYRAEFKSEEPLQSVRIDFGNEQGLVEVKSMRLHYGDGLVDLPVEVDVRELAAWLLVSRAVLNLDEAITTP